MTFPRATAPTVVQVVALLYLVLATTLSHGISWCSKEETNRILYVSTLDGALTALNFSGEKLWTYNPKYPLYSSTFAYLEFPNLIPGLDKNMYRWDGNELTRFPLSMDTLLEEPYSKKTGIVRSGARTVDEVALNIATGKVLYECTQFSCDKHDNQSLVGKIDRLLVTSHRTTIREANSLTGDEIWNFTLAQVYLSLIEGEESIERDFSCLLEGNESSLSVYTQTLQGLLVVSDKAKEISWDYQFSSPIVDVWLHHGGKLDKVPLSPLHSLANSNANPSLILGVWKNQYFIQPVSTDYSSLLKYQATEISCTVPDINVFLPQLPSSSIDISTSLTLYKEDIEWLQQLFTQGPNGLALYFHPKVIDQVSCPAKEENTSEEEPQHILSLALLKSLGSFSFYEWAKFFMKYSIFALMVLAVNKFRRYYVMRRRRLTSSTSSSSSDDDSVFISEDNGSYHNLNTLLSEYRRQSSSVSTLKPSTTNLQTIEEEEGNGDVRQSELSRFETEYEKLGILGKGGFGVVYHVLNKIDKNEYALKRIKLPTKKFAREKVMREVHALAQLDHAAIVRYFSSWVERAPPNWDQHKDWISSGQFNSTEDHLIDSSNSTSVATSVASTVHNGIPLSSLHNSDLPSIHSLTNESRNSSFAIEFREEDSLSKTNGIRISCHEDLQLKDGSYRAHSNEELHRYTPDSGKHFNMDPPSFLFIQMQLCQKQSMKDWLQSNIYNRQRTEILRQFEQILNAVVYVHKKDLMHRDLKPSNIFFSLNGNIKIGDFGLVTGNITPDTHSNSYIGLKQLTEEENRGNYRHTGNIGTHFYISPEQMNGLEYDQKVDVFSLGVILFELNYPFATEMERAKVLEKLRKNMIPPEFNKHLRHEAVLVEWLMSPVNKRPSAEEVTSSDKLLQLKQVVNNSDFTYIPKI